MRGRPHRAVPLACDDCAIVVVMSRLTAKQERFVQALVSGASQREAYRTAYNCKRMKPETIDSTACRLLKDPKIAARYDELMAELRAMVLWDRAKAAEVLLESQAIARSKVKQADVEFTDPDTGEKRKARDLPREASRFICDSTAELNRMFGVYDEKSGDEGKVVIIDDV